MGMAHARPFLKELAPQQPVRYIFYNCNYNIESSLLDGKRLCRTLEVPRVIIVMNLAH